MTSEKIAKLCAALSKTGPASIVSVWSTGVLFSCRADELRELVGDAVEARRLRHTAAVMQIEMDAMTENLRQRIAADKIQEAMAAASSKPVPAPAVLTIASPGMSGVCLQGFFFNGAFVEFDRPIRAEPVADVIGQLGSPHAAGFGPRNPLTGD